MCNLEGGRKTVKWGDLFPLGYRQTMDSKKGGENKYWYSARQRQGLKLTTSGVAQREREKLPEALKRKKIKKNTFDGGRRQERIKWKCG